MANVENMGKKIYKILIVEDEEPMAKALTLKFTYDGFEVKNACNGKEALKILSQERFDSILLDLIMPEMDGFTVLEEMKKRNINTSVFVMTNLGQESDRAKSMQLGAQEFFIKADTSLAEVVKRVKASLK